MYYGSNSNITDKQKEYLNELKNLPADIGVVVCVDSDASLFAYHALTNHRIINWSNYYAQGSAGNEISENVMPFPGLINLHNPQLNKALLGFVFLPAASDIDDPDLVSWKTMADYLWRHDGYSPDFSFQKVVCQSTNVCTELGSDISDKLLPPMNIRIK
jgi:hypothetical protein